MASAVSSGVIQATQPQADDQHHGKTEGLREIGAGLGVGQRHVKATRAFHHHRVCALRQRVKAA